MTPPLSATATRTRHLRAALRTTAFAYASVLGGATMVVAGAAAGGLRWALLAPVAWVAVVLALCIADAARRARFDFWSGLARSLGMSYVGATQLLPMTPLLAAGSTRRCDHWLTGRDAGAGLFTVRRGEDEVLGRATIAVVDLPLTMSLFPGVYVRRRGCAWPTPPRTRAVSLESADLAARYDVRCSVEHDPVQLRELFTPTLILWLAGHPLRPQLEVAGGVLVVHVDGHHEDAGTIVGLLDVAREVARRLGREVQEELATGRALPA
ncbi:MAG: hypothetical protein HZB46_08825 [Solirubrobacterales bacterium]|nr:hypothetical protein [Solirubrobacterales bacterium]